MDFGFPTRIISQLRGGIMSYFVLVFPMGSLDKSKRGRGGERKGVGDHKVKKAIELKSHVVELQYTCTRILTKQ